MFRGWESLRIEGRGIDGVGTLAMWLGVGKETWERVVGYGLFDVDADSRES